MKFPPEQSNSRLIKQSEAACLGVYFMFEVDRQHRALMRSDNFSESQQDLGLKLGMT